jgi:acetyltransferase-like isoleucine patch superfamily enzyme
MTNILPDRRIENDWWTAAIPAGVVWGEGLYVESAQVFKQFRTKVPEALVLGSHVSIYGGCSFALGVKGTCSVGDFTILNGALIMAEERINIGSYCMISWNVGIADSDFHPIDPVQRRLDALALAPFFQHRPPRPEIRTAPVVIQDNVWIGMGAVVLKGVTIGENSIVAAGAIVTADVPQNVVVAGNPARIVKQFA